MLRYAAMHRYVFKGSTLRWVHDGTGTFSIDQIHALFGVHDPPNLEEGCWPLIGIMRRTALAVKEDQQKSLRQQAYLRFCSGCSTSSLSLIAGEIVLAAYLLASLQRSGSHAEARLPVPSSVEYSLWLFHLNDRHRHLI